MSAEQSKGWNELEIDFRKRIDELNILFKNWIEDVQTMDVVSATGNLKVKIDSTKQGSIIDQLPSAEGELTIRARTTIQLDGDILSILPEKASNVGSQIDEQMIKIHKETVDMAMKNVSNNLKIFTDGVVQAISSLQQFNILPK
ncbi:MAG TPA: hypothetical protein VIA08_03605 [Nitrososphaeraceae archaeon]